ncbi:sugar transferase [Vibrio rotiferianus]|uniref:sugar transferase n=1 Tax=Vibrio rotiferianus TaxID=190895 RepID=UPI00390B55DA
MFKRLIDIVVSLFILVLSSPVMLVISILIMKQLGSPILFRQARPGINGELFEMLKFRSMQERYDASGKMLSDSERLSNFGTKLRSSSLDELPSLVNVLRGEMSLVGPRPLLPEYLPLYDSFQSRRHELKPGITGWAQVNGRNSLSWEDKFALDVWYIDNRSLWLDVKILFMTVLKVLKREGITQDGAATVEPFKGKIDD